MLRSTLARSLRAAPRVAAAPAARPAAFARFASASAKGAEPKPPVQLYGLDGTYATALYIAASKENALQATEKSIAALAEVLKADPQTRVILADPTLSPQDKAEAIKLVVEHVKGDKVLSGLLDTLSANARLYLLPDVIAQFGVLTDAARGVVKATVTSAKPLDAATLKRLEKTLAASEFVGSGKTLKLENPVEPSIRGGLVVSIGDRTVDASVATKLQRYNFLLQETI